MHIVFAVILGLAHAAVAFDLEPTRLIDLTHPFDASTIYWPTARRFTLERVAHGTTSDGYWYAANNFCAAEHGGTHLDAPVHFAEGRWTAEQIPLDRLVGPAAVVDVTSGAAADHDLLVEVRHLEGHESTHGRIPDGAIVLVHTGWDRWWKEPDRYLGSSTPGDAAHLHFPGLGAAAARWLVTDRRVRAVGIDTASIDRGPSRAFEAHRALAAANVPVFENLADLARLPPRGAVFIGLPMKITGGTGGPLRAVALLP